MSQPLQTNNKQFKVAVTFLTTYNEIFNFTNKNNEIYSAISITEDGFFRKTIPTGVYELESLNVENERIFNEEGHYTEEEYYPFLIKPNFQPRVVS